VGTESSALLALDPVAGAWRTLAGPEHGLRGKLLAVGASADALRLFALNDQGEVFEFARGRLRRLALAPDTRARLVARFQATPQSTASLQDPVSGERTWFALDGWAVWRIVPAR
jgi:hypothetical protein